MPNEQRIRTSIVLTARKISSQLGSNLNVEFESDALDLVAELIWKKVSSWGSDLEAFAQHAKRSTITADDVKLLVRRNNSLKLLMESTLKTIQEKRPPAESTGTKRKKSNP